MRRVEMTVHGRVQGVCFRMETRRAARGLGLVGMVRNVPDGTVHVVAEGTPKELDGLLSFVRVGPPGAIVNDVKYTWQEATGTFDEFEITY